MLRVPARRFSPSRSQRRSLKRNRDVRVALVEPRPSEEKYLLYRRYLALRHSGPMAGSEEEFIDFLFATNVQTVEIDYRLDGRLIGMGIVDQEPAALSAVYFCFDPMLSRRSLGVFNILTCIELCRTLARSYLYLGFYVRESRKMSYKGQYEPNQLLDADMRWRDSDSSREASICPHHS
jgi:arginyl-tRNA--protein-N-Asp/Glu arginylyltransferase